MNESAPPPLPPNPPPLPPGQPQPKAGPQPPPAASSGIPEPTYNLLADKIGGVPNVRKKDNVFQAVAIGVFLLIGLLVGALAGGVPEGLMIGGIVGLLSGTLISGFVLMIIGLCRKS